MIRALITRNVLAEAVVTEFALKERLVQLKSAHAFTMRCPQIPAHQLQRPIAGVYKLALAHPVLPAVVATHRHTAPVEVNGLPFLSVKADIWIATAT